MKRFCIAAALLASLATGAAADPVSTLAIGANGLWYNGNLDLPADFEFSGTGASSLSPHISAVGGVFYGIEHSYLRASIGARVTATDVENPDFSVGVGAQYHMSGEPSIRPEEWAGDVSIGWRPSPVNMPRVVVGVQGAYGFESEQTWLTLAVRYLIPVGAR